MSARFKQKRPAGFRQMGVIDKPCVCVCVRARITSCFFGMEGGLLPVVLVSGDCDACGSVWYVRHSVCGRCSASSTTTTTTSCAPERPSTPAYAATVKPSRPYSQRSSSSPADTHASFQACVKSSRISIWMTKKRPLPKRATQPACRITPRASGRENMWLAGRCLCAHSGVA